MSDKKTKLTRVTTETLSTLRELSRRTQLDMTVILDDIFKQIQLQLDLMEQGKRLLFMADFYNKDNVPKTIIRLSDALDSSFSARGKDLMFSKDGKNQIIRSD